MRKYKKIIEEFVVKEVWLTLYLSPYLIRFIIFFDEYPCFCFTKNLIISFAMDRIEFKSTDIAIDFFGWFL